MLAEPKLKSLNLLIQESSREELIWINGYVNGLLYNHAGEIPNANPQSIIPNNNAAKNFTILYGTETGNSQKLAYEFGARIKKHGIGSKIKSLEQYRLADLDKENNLLLVVSTHGEGDPPAAAKKFYDHIHTNISSLENINYSVFALGDSAYPLFCKAGEDIDNRLNHLGAKRITPIGKADTDFETAANEWIDEVIQQALDNTSVQIQHPVIIPKKITGKKNYKGNIISKINLNDAGSEKETWHVEIQTEEGLEYAPGDAIGIIAHNKKKDIDLILQLTSTLPATVITYRDQSLPMNELLEKKLNIHHLPIRIIQAYAQLTGREIPDTRMDFAHLLKIYPPEKEINIETLLSLMEPITPRLYSIASAPAAHGKNELHITVAKNAFYINDEKQNGFCSDYLSTLEAGDSFDFYIQKNNAFKLPSPETDIILIGPGTGIAPFRSFLFEREAQSAPGRNWLFFGEQHFATDFLYQTEIQFFLQTGVLTKFNAAFSRDQQEKIYVQHRMKQQGADLFKWIESGAHIYICGTKDPMSNDVENTLLDIISTHLESSPEQATAYFNTIKEQGRYHKDVY